MANLLHGWQVDSQQAGTMDGKAACYGQTLEGNMGEPPWVAAWQVLEAEFQKHLLHVTWPGSKINIRLVSQVLCLLGRKRDISLHNQVHVTNAKLYHLLYLHIQIQDPQRQ